MKINNKNCLAAIAGLVAVNIVACGEDAAVVLKGQCGFGDNMTEECVKKDGSAGSGGDTNTAGAGGDSGNNAGGDSGSSSGGDTGSGGKDSGNSGGADSGGTAGGDAAGGSDTGSGGDGAGGDSSGGGPGDSGPDGGGIDGTAGGDSGKDGGVVGSACASTGDCSGLLVCCGSKCVDPNADVTYCGANTSCVGGKVCGSGAEVSHPFCQVGVCTAGCIGKYAECPDLPMVCRNTDTDNNHCGMLCLKCKAGKSCVGGTCVP